MAPKPGGGAPERKRGRTAKACVQCRATKTRCTFLGASTTCDKCTQRGISCSMLPPGQRVSGRGRAGQQPASPDRGSADSPSQPEPESASHAPELTAASPEPTTATTQTPNGGNGANHIAPDSAEPPVASWPAPLSATPPQAPAEPGSWLGTPQTAGTAHNTPDAPLHHLPPVAGRHSLPQLHQILTTQSAAPVIVSPHAAVAGSPAGLAHAPIRSHSVQLQYPPQGVASPQAPYQRESYGQHPPYHGRAYADAQYQAPLPQQQHAPVFHQHSYEEHAYVPPPSLPQAQPQPQQQPQPQHLQQQYEERRYQEQLQAQTQQHSSVSQAPDSQPFAPSVYLNSSHFHLDPQVFSTVAPASTVNPLAASNRGPLYRSTADPLSRAQQQQPASIDFRALVNSESGANSLMGASPSPVELMDDGADVLGPQFGTRGFLGDLDVEDILKVDNEFDEALRPNEETLRAVRLARTRFRFETSPEYTTLQLVDPAFRGRFSQASKLLRAQPRVTTRHLLTIGLLSRSQVVTLLGVFRDNFNHWVDLPTEPDASSLLELLLSKCPLLVTAACCVALRLCHREVWARYYPVLVNFLHAEFAATILEMPQNLQFIQAMTTMALYADSLTCDEYVFDGHFLSGLGMQHLITLGSLTSSLTHIHLRLWNHLCLANVSSAVLTGRHTVVTEEASQLCKRILLEPRVDRFDRCVVAEILAWRSAFCYSSYQISFADLGRENAQWKKDFSSVNSGFLQLVQPVFLFAEFICRWTHAWRMQTRLSPASRSTDAGMAADTSAAYEGIVSASVAASMTSESLIEDLTVLTSTVTHLLDSIHDFYFGCISDQLRNIAFIATVLAMQIRGFIIERGDDFQETRAALTQFMGTARRLLERLQITSRGLDLARIQSYALLRLLQTAVGN